MAIDLVRLQSYDAAPLMQVDQQVNDAIKGEHAERRRRIEDRRQRKLKKRKQKRKRDD